MFGFSSYSGLMGGQVEGTSTFTPRAHTHAQTDPQTPGGLVILATKSSSVS